MNRLNLILLIACLVTACAAHEKQYRPDYPELGSQSWHNYMADKTYLNKR